MPDAVIKSMSEALSTGAAEEALLQLSEFSEENAIRLAEELAKSLASMGNGNGPTTVYDRAAESKQNEEEAKVKHQYYPIDIPKCLVQSKVSSKSKYQKEENPLQTAKACTESILASLGKVASGGSQASSELRKLETTRRQKDSKAKDLNAALQLRQLASFGADALGARRYTDAARAVNDYRRVQASERAMVIAGPHSARAYERTRDVLQRTVLEHYENAVAERDLKGLSELTPLLGMLDLANKGVGLYLRYSQTDLTEIMNAGLEEDQVVETKQQAQQEEENAGVRISRAEQRRREQQGAVTVCTKLAKIFNTAVTHLRHHLPMVAFSLGDADGDAALVQLVHIEVEKRATEIVKSYIQSAGLKSLRSKASVVANMLEERCLSGEVLDEGLFGEESGFLGITGGASTVDKAAALESMDDCGFKMELGTFVKMNSRLDEIALLMQHAESYERFIRHAVDEVDKARDLRRTQKRDERKKQWMAQLENEGKDATLEEAEKFDQNEKKLEASKRVQDVLPPQTQLNEIIAEVGGYLSGLERAFFLGNLQRAFFNVSLPDGSNYSPLTTMNANRPRNSAGCRALQTSLVEECFYAAQQSTLRAFATGHSGIASSAANVCSDILGRVLLESLSHRAEAGSSLLKPGDGLLSGQAGLGQAALSVMSTAQKGLGRKTRVGVDVKEEALAAMKQEEINAGIARSCASLNDLEVAVDYTRRLERKLIEEMGSTFPPNRQETDQLKACITSLSGVMESYQNASKEASDHLTAILMPRIRSIVNECVGQDSATSTSFMTTGTVTTTSVKMNYNLDDAAYELAQISEGYMSRL